MRIGVLGAGAVGCYYGGQLARAGHDVVLVGRPLHMRVVAERGLRLQSEGFDGYVRLEAAEEARALRAAELVLCCVKSTDTEPAALSLAPHLAAGAEVLSLQNGVDNAERMTRILGRAVHPAVVYVAVAMAGPGHVRHYGRGELVLQQSPLGERLAPLFAQAGVPVQLVADLTGALWAKLLLNCAYNALSAIVQLPYGRLAQSPGVEAVLRDVTSECLEVARAQGVAMPEDSWAEVQRIARTMPGQYSSTAQDLQRGRPSEIDHLNGFIVRRGEALGVAVPANRVLQVLVRLLETRGGAAAG